LAQAHAIPIEVAEESELRRLIGENAVHQGVALEAEPLEPVPIEDLLDRPAGARLVLVLDQVTDPHNVGAMLRSAAAFGADGVIMQDRHAPPLTGVVAKAASGAVDVVPVIRVVNIARTVEELKDAGFTAIGLAEEGEKPLSQLKTTGDIALLLGAEGEGLRRLVRDTCHWLARLPTNPRFASLNVSNAAAVALYELRRQ
jgi:23S rRNA (guanosine2251-2'-O)-methyltransferase